MMTEIHLYRLWHCETNNRTEMARFRAKDVDDVINYVKKEFLKPDTVVKSEFGDEISLYLDLDICITCEVKKALDTIEEDCMGCDISEYLQIELDDEIEPKYDTIQGTSEFYDLTNPEDPLKMSDWSPELVKAWEISPQGGAEALIAKTVEDNPELARGVDSELLRRGRAALKGEKA